MGDDPGARVWKEARGLVGCRFRLHGRDPAYGLDCVGLALVAARRAGAKVAAPDRYALIGGDGAYWLRMIGDFGLEPSSGATGDIVLLDCGRRQFHLCVAGPTSAVHAHRGLGRVVETPGLPQGAVISRRRVPDRLFR